MVEVSDARQMAVAAAVTAAVVVGASWFTGLQTVFGAALVGVAVFAFLPFVIIAAGLALFVVALAFMMMLAALTEGAGGGDASVGEVGASIAEVGGWLVGPYYRFLGRQTHPLFWGIPAGVLVGGVITGGLFALLVLPGERATARAMGEAQGHIEAVYEDDGSFPEADDGRLLVDGEAVEDGFGTPLRYEVKGRWKLASWQLRAAGADGEFGTDTDFCLSGTTKLAEAVDTVRGLIGDVDAPAGVAEELDAVHALRCQ